MQKFFITCLIWGLGLLSLAIFIYLHIDLGELDIIAIDIPHRELCKELSSIALQLFGLGIISKYYTDLLDRSRKRDERQRVAEAFTSLGNDFDHLHDYDGLGVFAEMATFLSHINEKITLDKGTVSFKGYDEDLFHDFEHAVDELTEYLGRLYRRYGHIAHLEGFMEEGNILMDLDYLLEEAQQFIARIQDLETGILLSLIHI